MDELFCASLDYIYKNFTRILAVNYYFLIDELVGVSLDYIYENMNRILALNYAM